MKWIGERKYKNELWKKEEICYQPSRYWTDINNVGQHIEGGVANTSEVVLYIHTLCISKLDVFEHWEKIYEKTAQWW